MHSANAAPSTRSAVDTRLRPAYYFGTESLGSYVTGLLARCPSVFDLKKTMAADLDHEITRLRHGHGVIEDGALHQGEVVVHAGARIETSAQVIGPVLVCTGSVISAGALVRDHSVIGPGCRIGFGAEITRSLLAGHVFIKHPCFIGDSVIGRGVNIGSFCSTTGLRCDRAPSPNRRSRTSPSTSTGSGSPPGKPSSALSSATRSPCPSAPCSPRAP